MLAYLLQNHEILVSTRNWGFLSSLWNHQNSSLHNMESRSSAKVEVAKSTEVLIHNDGVPMPSEGDH
jgi:hypothetical protein